MQSKTNKLFKNVNQFLIPDYLPDGCKPMYEIDKGYSFVSCSNNKYIKLPLYKTYYDQIESHEYFSDVPLEKSNNLTFHDYNKILTKLLDYASYINNTRFKSIEKAVLYLSEKDLYISKVIWNQNGRFKNNIFKDSYIEKIKPDFMHFDAISPDSLFILPDPEYLGVLSLKNFNNFDEKEFEFGMAVVMEHVAKVQLD